MPQFKLHLQSILDFLNRIIILFKIFRLRNKYKSGVLGKLYKKDDSSYKEYIENQLQKSLNHLVKGYSLHPRTIRLVNKLEKVLRVRNGYSSALCIGCRDIYEIEYMKKTCGLKNVKGIDLFSDDERIIVGDMHSMPFKDSEFDILYSSHSFEHSYDPQIAAQEFLRVTKKGGIIVIEVPLKYQTNQIDRFDAVSTKGILKFFEKRIDKILLEETEDPDNINEFVGRIIIRV